MATKTYYLVNGVDADGWQDLSESTQSAVNCNAGWVVGTGSTNHSELASNSERASSTFTGTTVPDGTLDTSLKDALRIPTPLSGQFASANWSFQFAVVSPTQGGAADGRIRIRLIKAKADGSSATEITGAQQQASIVTNVASSPDSDSTLTLNPGSFRLDNQYLFIQVAWERTGAGGMTTTNIRLRTGSASTPTGTVITTSDFTPDPVGQSADPLPTVPRPWQSVAALTIALGLIGGPLYLAVNGNAPFTQNDWPNPVQPGRYLERSVNQVSPALLNPVAPFRQSDWPNPQTGGWLEVFVNTRPVESPTPVAPIEWVIPPGGPNPLFLRTFTHNRPQFYQDQQPPPTLEWPNPLRKGPAPAFDPPNTLVTVLAPPSSPPPTVDWPIVRGRSPLPPTWLDWRELHLVDEFPSGKAELPQPQAKPYLRQLTEWTQNRPQFQTDAMTAGAVSVELPRAKPIYDAVTPPQNLLLGPLALPFKQTEWPTPLRATPDMSLRTWLQARPQFYVDAMAPLPFDWPNPQRAGSSLELRTWTQNLQQTTLGTIVPPVRPLDWPLPQSKPHAVSLRTLTDGRKAFHVDLSPANQFDWPLPPPARRRGVTDEPQNLLLTTLARPVGQQIDWSIPTRRATTPGLQTWLQGPPNVTPTPFSQTDWPVPTGKRAAVGLTQALINTPAPAAVIVTLDCIHADGLTVSGPASTTITTTSPSGATIVVTGPNAGSLESI